MHYTEPRYTKDLDVWIEASLENRTPVFRALQTFGAPLANLSLKTSLKRDIFIQSEFQPCE